MLAGMEHAPLYSHPLTLDDATAIAELLVCIAAKYFTAVFREETSRPISMSAQVWAGRIGAIDRARDSLMQASDDREYLYTRRGRASCRGVI